ncbi:RluA family pseudouridine synthase [Myxosarcina sp. GI1]|uniref:RluA family pseudouridine synthase n=1 Tax=Myxosarcina sp. GI1 TaxID=1541065 RepID=UPI00055E0FE0|nr:RluA family pseudouridine synthase [Myxosarcina sp. GI1]
MNQGWIYRERVNKFDAGQTILSYYNSKYRHSSKEEWRERIIKRQILLDESPATPETKLTAGQKLAYHRPPWNEPPVPLDFTVLYEDSDLLAIAKPKGLPVLPGGGFLEHTLWWQLQQKYSQPIPVPVHRLGRGTSGIMLLARSHLAKSSLSHQLRTNSIDKVYLALVSGTDIPQHLIISDHIGKIPHSSLGYIYGATSQGKSARSECRVLSRQSDRTIVEVTIFTGRPHQIRIHLAAAGFPLLGDPLYLPGGKPRLISSISEDKKLPVPSDCGYYLHAYRLGFTHPRSGDKITLECKPPLELSV